jgi:hypothetical protein
MINGDNRNKTLNSKKYNASHEEVHSKQPPQSNPRNITIETNTDNSKVSFIQKVLNFIEDFLNIKLSNRKVNRHDTSNYIAMTGVSEKNHFKFNITNNIDAIETPIDYIHTNNKLIIYNNLDRIVGYFNDFIDNYSTIGAVNQDTVIEFLENKTKNIVANIVILDKKGSSHSIIPPDIDYLTSLNNVELKTAITQVNQELKKFMNATFESRGYNSDTERERLASAIKSKVLLKDIQNKDSFLLHALETQVLTLEIPDGNIKVTHATANESKFNNIDKEEDIINEFSNNNINSSVNNTDELFYEDIEKKLSKLAKELQNAQLEDSTTLQQLPDQQENNNDTSSKIQHLLSKKTSYYQLTYEIYDIDI